MEQPMVVRVVGRVVAQRQGTAMAKQGAQDHAGTRTAGPFWLPAARTVGGWQLRGTDEEYQPNTMQYTTIP